MKTKNSMNIVIVFLFTLRLSSAFFLGKTSTLRHKYHYTNYRLQSSKLSSGDSITIPLKEDPDSNTKIGAWIPIASAHSLAGLGPQKIRVMGIDLVVWNSGHESHYDEKTGEDTSWSVMADVCPHRLAPLSQGRVDPETGCIECPYHGWQFDTDGILQKNSSMLLLLPILQRILLGT
jgi:nitrite reductase/ring-hydroxylating ferredoxin subunit